MPNLIFFLFLFQTIYTSACGSISFKLYVCVCINKILFKFLLYMWHILKLKQKQKPEKIKLMSFQVCFGSADGLM